jgi:hypothetical protein
MKRQANQPLQGGMPKRQAFAASSMQGAGYSSGRFDSSSNDDDPMAAAAADPAVTDAQEAAAGNGPASQDGRQLQQQAAGGVLGGAAAGGASGQAQQGFAAAAAQAAPQQQGLGGSGGSLAGTEVGMLADAQDLMMSILQYMVRHNQFSRPQHGQQQPFMPTNGYDLCRFKQDFTDKFKYDCNNKALGFSRVKEMMQFLMGDVAELATVGAGGSHVVVYPRLGVDYSKPRCLDAQQLLSHVQRHPDISGNLASIQQQLQLYQQHAEAQAAAAAQDGPVAAAAVGGAGSGSAVIPALGGGADNSGSGSAALVPQPPVRSLRAAVPGLDAPPSAEQLAAQQQQTPREQLTRWLRLQLLQLRVAAQRTAVVEAWTSSYMLLDDVVDTVLKQDQPQQQKQQQGGEGEADGAAADGAGMQGMGKGTDHTSADGAAAAAAAATGGGAIVKDEEDSLLEGLVEGGLAAAAAPAGAEEDDKALLEGLSQEDAAAAGNAAGASTNGASAEPAAANGSSGAAAAAAPGIRVRPSGPSTGDQKYAAGVAARAVQLLQQWPLLLAELAAGWAAQHPEAHAQLSQVRPHTAYDTVLL